MTLTDTNQAGEDELNKTVERLLRFNCPNGCDGNGSYPEMGSDGEWEQGQCQWCFEYGMPARGAIQSLIRTEKLKLLAEARERVGQSMPDIAFLGTSIRVKDNIRDNGYYDGVRDSRLSIEEELNKLEAEL